LFLPPLPPILVEPARPSSQGREHTKEQRVAILNQQQTLMNELVSSYPEEFDKELSYIDERVKTLTLKSQAVAEHPLTQSLDLSQSSQTTFIANPPTQRSQNQSRHQGSVPHAPGTKANKKAGKKAQQKRKAEERSLSQNLTGKWT